jgi:Transglutaminase-like superfamily
VKEAGVVRRARRLRGRLRGLERLRHLTEPGLPTVRGAGWAMLALRRLRREIPREGLDVRVLAPPRTAPTGLRGVEAALRLRRATCLERSLIVQRWLMAFGSRHDVLLGVGRGSGTMEAHAWIHRYDPDVEGEGLELLSRIAPRD